MIIIVDQTDGNTESSQSEDVIGQVKPHQKKKPTVKGFELFESLGLVMGVSIMTCSQYTV